MEEKVIFECIVGSHAYGTNIDTSDIDIKGVYQQQNNDVLGFKYKEQINKDKDTTFYEVRRFLELAATANPTILEMLFVDEQFIKTMTPQFKILRDYRHLFLTKQCRNSFGGYAMAQIKKAKGLNKKMNWEKEKTVRKTPLDFCFVHEDGKSINIVEWLKQQGDPLGDCPQEAIGLAAIDRMPGCYSIYIDYGRWGEIRKKPHFKPLGFKGIAFEDSNDIRLSSIPKDQQCRGILYYNKDAYSIHCKEYNEYTKWLENRNTERYIDTDEHGQQIDGKNLMHCVRLIRCGMEIANTGNFNVYRKDDRDYLLAIRKGDVSLNAIIEDAERSIADMDKLFEDSNLPDKFDMGLAHDLLIKIRHL